jgi:alkylation response protein AidB-like acyl-CoA dehydrogenase
MDILNYTDDHKAFRQRLKTFLENEVTPNVDQWEQDHIVPKSAWQKMGKEGYLCTWVPPEYGGMGGDFLYSVIVAEEMARTNHTGLASMLHSDIIVPYIYSFGTEIQKKKYLPGCVSGDIITAIAMTEPAAGSDLAGMEATAELDGNEIVINGSKTFISNGINADLVIVAAKNPAEENPYQALSLYIVEDGTPGFKRGRQLEKMGFHSQDTAELFFSNCRIPKDHILGDPGNGFMMLMEKLQQERLMCAIGAQAASELILEYTIDFCKNNTDASGKPYSKYQATQFALVEMLTEIKLGRTFIDKLVAEHASGANIVVDTSLAKYWTTDLANRLAKRCLDFFGDFGLTEDCNIARALRDVRVMSIFAGTNEIMKGIAAKFINL